MHTGRRGHPRKSINQAFLENALSPGRNIHLTRLSQAIGVHRNTLRTSLRQSAIVRRFSGITDHELDIVVRRYKRLQPQVGLRYMIGHFRRHGIRIQKERIRLSLARVDRLGQALRNHHAIDRRVYEVPRPNALWHLDGHHKLIRWGIVIHGIVDGYSRTVSV